MPMLTRGAPLWVVGFWMVAMRLLDPDDRVLDVLDQRDAKPRVAKQACAFLVVVGVHHDRRRYPIVGELMIADDRMSGAGHELTLLLRIEVDDAGQESALGVDQVGERDALGAR